MESPPYVVTDDSAAEQRGVRKAFWGLIDNDTEIDHWLCQKHSERSLKRALGADNCKESFEHLYRALYVRQSSMGCEEDIQAAIRVAPEQKKEYIRREWWDTRRQWAYYARQHSCILLQCMTTNAVASICRPSRNLRTTATIYRTWRYRKGGSCATSAALRDTVARMRDSS